jgi:hypothetical protein
LKPRSAAQLRNRGIREVAESALSLASDPIHKAIAVGHIIIGSYDIYTSLRAAGEVDFSASSVLFRGRYNNSISSMQNMAHPPSRHFILITGISGSGKTEYGEHLEKAYQFHFIETDKCIPFIELAVTFEPLSNSKSNLPNLRNKSPRISPESQSVRDHQRLP